MTRCEPGDVVLVDFPFTDLTRSKRRPAVIVSSAAYAELRPDVVAMPITSRFGGSASFGETPIVAWRECGLVKPSAVKPLLFTIDRSLLLGPLGSLALDDWRAVRDKLSLVLG